MYFQRLPQMFYSFDIGGKLVTKIVTDTTFNVRLLKNVLENITLYDEYVIRDGETPEIISDKIFDFLTKNPKQ